MLTVSETSPTSQPCQKPMHLQIFDSRHFCSTVFNSGPQGEKEFLAGPFSDAALASIAGFTPKQLVCLLDGLTLAGDFGLLIQVFQLDLSHDANMMQICKTRQQFWQTDLKSVTTNKYAIQMQPLCSDNRTLAAGCLRKDVFFATMEETWPREHKVTSDISKRP